MLTKFVKHQEVSNESILKWISDRQLENTQQNREIAAKEIACEILQQDHSQITPSQVEIVV